MLVYNFCSANSILLYTDDLCNRVGKLFALLGSKLVTLHHVYSYEAIFVSCCWGVMYNCAVPDHLTPDIYDWTKSHRVGIRNRNMIKTILLKNSVRHRTSAPTSRTQNLRKHPFYKILAEMTQGIRERMRKALTNKRKGTDCMSKGAHSGKHSTHPMSDAHLGTNLKRSHTSFEEYDSSVFSGKWVVAAPLCSNPTWRYLSVASMLSNRSEVLRLLYRRIQQSSETRDARCEQGEQRDNIQTTYQGMLETLSVA